MENTLVIIKPDGVRKNVIFEVLKRFTDAKLQVSNVKVMQLDEELVNEHYSHLLTKPFYPEILNFMLSGPVVVMIVSGENAVLKVRSLVGATDSKKALPGTIRGDFGNKEIMCENIIHASDSVENANIEINRFYKDELENVLENKKLTKKR